MRTKFTIEIEIFTRDDDHVSVGRDLVADAARTLNSQLLMLAGMRKPKVSVKIDNAMFGEEDINIFEGQ